MLVYSFSNEYTTLRFCLHSPCSSPFKLHTRGAHCKENPLAGHTPPQAPRLSTSVYNNFAPSFFSRTSHLFVPLGTPPPLPRNTSPFFSFFFPSLPPKCSFSLNAVNPRLFFCGFGWSISHFWHLCLGPRDNSLFFYLCLDFFFLLRICRPYDPTA